MMFVVVVLCRLFLLEGYYRKKEEEKISIDLYVLFGKGWVMGLDVGIYR